MMMMLSVQAYAHVIVSRVLLSVDDAWCELVDGSEQIERSSQTLVPLVTALLCVHQGQGHRSKFKVAARKCSLCD